MDRHRRKHNVTKPKLALATLTLIVGMVLAGGTPIASAAAPEVEESASLRLTPMGLTKLPLSGFTRLRLRISELAGTSFRATVQVEGDGLVVNRLYAMWLSVPESNTPLADTARSDEGCEVDPSTSGKLDCEVVVKLRSSLPQASFDLTLLESLTINARENIIGTQANTPILPTGTVSTSHLRGVTVTSRPSNLGTNIGNPFGDLPDSAAPIGSSSRPPVIGRSVGSSFGLADKIRDIRRRSDEAEKEERRLEEEEEEQGAE